MNAPAASGLRPWLTALADRPLAVFLAFSALYLSGAASGPAGGDTGEYMALAAVGGVAHPPGYPLYTLLLRAFAALVPAGTIAWRASALSALLGAGALAVMHDALRRLVAPGWALAAVAALGLGFSFWRMATVAEVFAGAALIEALALWVAVRVHLGWRGPSAAAALGGVAALGVTHHHTILLLAPLFGWALWTIAADTGGRRSVGAFTAALLPGPLLYLTLLLPGGWRWGAPETLSDILHIILRMDYGTFSLTRGGDQDTPGWRHVLAFLSARPMEWHLWFFLATPLGIWAGLRATARPLIGALLASWLLAGPGLVALFHTPVERLMFLQRFYLLSDVLLAPLVALGLHAAAGARRPLIMAGTLTALALGALQAAPVAPSASREAIPLYVDAVLNALPADAVLVVDADTAFSALLYAQLGEGRRPDVAVVGEGLIGASWYADRLRRADPARAAAVAQSADLPELLSSLSDRRPVFLTLGFVQRPALYAQLGALVPAHGLLLEHLPASAKQPTLAEIDRLNSLAAQGLDLGPALGSPVWERRTYEAWPAGQAALLWQGLGEAWLRQGDRAAAERCFELARWYRPSWTGLSPWAG